MPPTSPMEKWNGIRVALKFRPVCPQRLPDLEDLERRLPLTTERATPVPIGRIHTTHAMRSPRVGTAPAAERRQLQTTQRVQQ